MILTKEYLTKNYIKLLVPIAIVLGLGYFNFVVNYSLGYKLVYVHHSQPAAIILWVLIGFLQLALFTYWILIFFVGPGKSPIIPPYNLYNEQDNPQLIPVPDLFFCDELGYPYYCSRSKSIKLERSFFSKDVGYNVVKFDHYCVWIGHPIGQDNYLFFMKFGIYFFCLFLIALIYVSRYTRDSINQGEIDHNFIVLYIFSGFWMIMIACLMGVHFWYISLNMTTLDDITKNQRKRYNRWLETKDNESTSSWIKPRIEPRKELGTRFVNVKMGDSRAIIKYYIDEKPFDMGVQKNWINLVLNGNRNHGLKELYYNNFALMYSFCLLFIPFIDIPICFRNRLRLKRHLSSENSLDVVELYSSAVNKNFLDMIEKKIATGDFKKPAYLYKEDSSLQ